ncbi:MAG: pantoate--beta-alanine ligase [Actinomycetota bacterium]|nr:pantoate--beta-alanine ligase [Actinomycetota bacterium]
MKVARTETELRGALRGSRARGRSIGFVPTMGALHPGHLSLVAAARAETDVVVLSIFVNPLQFGPSEDLAAYPRPEGRDLQLAEQAGVDVAFLPPVSEMYRPGRSTTLSLAGPAVVLEGAARPGHFDGVATVVAKLFNQVQPDRAYFGQKDAQQVAVIKAMVRDLSIPVEVVVCPTVREPDGLALSSRNAYLVGSERTAATVLWRALQAGSRAVEEGAAWEVAEKTMEQVVAGEAGVSLEYARAVDPETFEPASGRAALLVIAARVGRARLIDNLPIARS